MKRTVVVLLVVVVAPLLWAQAETATTVPRSAEVTFTLPVPPGLAHGNKCLSSGLRPGAALHRHVGAAVCPGFFKSESEEFWSYAFEWYLDGDVPLTTTRLGTDLETYFEG